MNVLLLQLDGKLPNVALMRLASHHRARGDTVTLRKATRLEAIERPLWEMPPATVYASAIFDRSQPLIERVKQVYPHAIVGGTGSGTTQSLEEIGVNTVDQDYSIYPKFTDSIGFTQRGCRFKCSFCRVPKMEGKVRAEQGIYDLWRGEGHPRHLLLLDNDFFGQIGWQDKCQQIRDGGFKVAFSQGINARVLTDEVAETVASLDYRDDSMKTKRLYTAWDNRGHERKLFEGLERVCRAGVKPDHLMVYMLIGYWPGETHEDRDYRRRKLREFGARPYPMPFERSRELVGFQRWVIGAYDKRIPWADWQAAKYQPMNLGYRTGRQADLFVEPPAAPKPEQEALL